MRRKIFLTLVFLFTTCGTALCENNHEYTTNDLLNMTQQSLRYDFQKNTAYVRGVGKIMSDDLRSVVLARRTAISDAQRGLLVLRREIEEGQPPRMDSVSGFVPPIKILSENMQDGLYFVEIEADLSQLMQGEQKKYRKELSQ